MFKIITMSDSNYFDCGDLFLKTRARVNADFILYGPDLNTKQINILEKNDVEYIKIDDNMYKTQMQFLKFDFIINQIKSDPRIKPIGVIISSSINNYATKYKGFTLVDFDTFFINDWGHVFDYEFDFGVTIRNDRVKQKLLRAYTNGGVVFAKHFSLKLLEFAKKTVLDGQSKDLPEYDRIWKTLELNRPAHKTHYRTVLRWWVDQVFLSSIALRYFEKYGYCKIGLDPAIFDFNGTKVGLFGCNYYNVLESKPDTGYKKNIYIRHLKTTGREFLGVNKTVEKL